MKAKKKNVIVIDDTKTKKKVPAKKKVETDPVITGVEIDPVEKEQQDAPIDNVEEEYDEEDSFGDNENEIEDEDKEDKGDAEVSEEDNAEVVEGEAGPGEPAVLEEDDCVYNYADDRSDDDDGQEIVFDDDGLEITSEIIPSDQRRTKPILFKYERVRLLGDRAQQLTLGAKPMIKNVEGLTPKEIAELEIAQNVIPLIIQRPLPNGKKERWYIKELKH